LQQAEKRAQGADDILLVGESWENLTLRCWAESKRLLITP
jgi:hypothetical protein